MYCTILKWLIEHAPTDSVKAHLQAAFDEHCADDSGVHPLDGGTGQGGPPK